MASLDYHRNKASGCDTVKAVALLVVLLAAYVLVCTMDGRSNNPDTGCAYGQVLTASGECR